jgi:hypothetical protein
MLKDGADVLAHSFEHEIALRRFPGIHKEPVGTLGMPDQGVTVHLEIILTGEIH